MTSNVVHLRATDANYLGITSVFRNDPYASDVLDIDEVYAFIPNIPGVLILIGGNNRAISIEACDRSMRQRAIECYKGFGGKACIGAVRIAFEASSEPAVREKSLVEEHRLLFGSRPLLNRA